MSDLRDKQIAALKAEIDRMKAGGKMFDRGDKSPPVLDIPAGLMDMGKKAGKKAGGMMKKKGMAKGGMAKKGMAKGGMAKKGYAMGGVMKKKGMKKGGKVRGAGIVSKGVRSAKMVTMKGS